MLNRFGILEVFYIFKSFVDLNHLTWFLLAEGSKFSNFPFHCPVLMQNCAFFFSWVDYFSREHCQYKDLRFRSSFFLFLFFAVVFFVCFWLICVFSFWFLCFYFLCDFINTLKFFWNRKSHFLGSTVVIQQTLKAWEISLSFCFDVLTIFLSSITSLFYILNVT